MSGSPVEEPPAIDLDSVYERRFEGPFTIRKAEMWRPIVRYLERYFVADAPILDLACDQGYFIRHVRDAERWAVDVRDMSATLPPGVRFVQADGLHLADHLPVDHFGTVFMSNYLEHLASGSDVVRQLEVARQLLRPGGRVIVLQPNIRLVGPTYWDFIDHRVALTEKSLVEAAEVAGFRHVKLVTRFLPFTTKGRLPVDHRLVAAYLRIPAAWLLLGKQTLYVGERPAP